MRDYLDRVATGDGEFLDVLPYLGLIRLPAAATSPIVGGDDDDDEAAEICYGILAEKLDQPVLPRADLVVLARGGRCWCRRMNAITWRFQNRTAAPRGRDPLASLDIDPLRPLNNLLWGYIQDEQHRLTTRPARLRVRPPVRPGARGQAGAAGARRRLPLAVHRGVPQPARRCAAVFYTQDDDTTVIADGFRRAQRAQGDAPAAHRRARTTSTATCPGRRGTRC